MVSKDIEVILDELPSYEVRAIIEAGRRLKAYPDVDERVQEIRESWPREAFRLDTNQRDWIGHLFLQKVLGLDRDALQSFKNEEAESLFEVYGRLESFAHPRDPGDRQPGEEFWGAVHESIPGFLDRDQANLLKGVDRNGVYAWEMISIFDEVNPTSQVLYKLKMLL